MEIRVRKHLLDFERESYVTDCEEEGLRVEEGTAYLDCSLGINPFGYSKEINSARRQFLEYKDVNRYPDYPYNRLKKLLIEYWKEVAYLDVPNIKIGCGSIGIIANINKLFIDSGIKTLGYCPQFTDFMVEVKCCNGIYEYILLKPDNNYRFNSSELISAMTREHRLVYIDNPNNPTGQVIPVSEIKSIAEQARKMDVCVLVDEAYGDFMDEQNSAISLVNDYDNVLVARSFSKGFGLAAYRVGYLITGERIGKYYSKIDYPFAVSAPAEVIVCSVLKDKGFISSSRKSIYDIKKKIVESCSKISVLETDMSIPIMALSHPNKNIDLYSEFKKRGILTEPGEAYVGLGKNSVRLRVSKEAYQISSAIKDIESEI
ncbi:MAG: histidinol-phosphate transaminase [Bacillota bacterium]|nr:histidinol-phosphate transaminase [Bacillota bacterium]MDD3850710.1 histidinol-phosphate transaminase [Bacillota bacterium]MDD4707968.1 histidinol-phosphate transaminase [Bacillota bacterium]